MDPLPTSDYRQHDHCSTTRDTKAAFGICKFACNSAITAAYIVASEIASMHGKLKQDIHTAQIDTCTYVHMGIYFVQAHLRNAIKPTQLIRPQTRRRVK